MTQSLRLSRTAKSVARQRQPSFDRVSADDYDDTGANSGELNVSVAMYLLIAFGILIALGSILGILFPAWLLQQVKAAWQTSGAMNFAVGFRILLGSLLILFAPQTEFPSVFRVLGILGLIAAVGLPLLGWQRIDNLLAWFESRPRIYIRTPCVLGLLLGVFVVYGVM